MSYPLDISGISAGECKLVNISQEEMSTEEAQRFVEDGIMFIRSYYEGKDVQSFMNGIDALSVNKPVLYRDESGSVGLMVYLTGYGQGDPAGKTALPVEWIGEGKRFWRVINFRYFIRNDDYRWQYGGQVYKDGE
ncbi:MAG: hypothetical protein C4538_07145 [Nitrospiraceae bacterium]|nr:MAG: hypothetical protein C4538_07145 [Nitrospiraceae bacterium]